MEDMVVESGVCGWSGGEWRGEGKGEEEGCWAFVVRKGLGESAAGLIYCTAQEGGGGSLKGLGQRRKGS